MVPFFVYTTVFLLIPTIVVIVGAFVSDGRPTLGNVRALGSGSFLTALKQSLILSVVTALVGALIGGVLAYAVSTARPGGVLRRFVSSLCGVLAQFGGVALAFAFIASFGGGSGMISGWMSKAGIGPDSPLWLYEWDKGLMLVYLYFQIPLMLIVFLPAVEGLRPQWREATETLGGNTWTYWWRVGIPILLPSFIGAVLLLFTNAFSAYATAAALVSQGQPLVPLQIAGTFTSETVLGEANVGKAMALAMVVVVAVVMTIYAWVDKRASRWLVR